MYKQNFIRQLSWKKLNLFLQCPRCFYKEQILGLKRPGIDFDTFSLNNVVDALLKNEFDQYRQQQKAHPIMLANNIDAVPFSGELLYMWRDYQAGGIRFRDRTHAIELYGFIDDLWVTPEQELIIVDYKTTIKHKSFMAFSLKSKWNETNKRQMAFYAALFKKCGYLVHNTGYFVYNSVLNKPFFNQRLDFETILHPCGIDDSWIDSSLLDIRNCINQSIIPNPSADCEYCNFEC